MTNLDKMTEAFKLAYEKFIIGCDSIEEMEKWNKEELGEMEAFYVNDLVSVIIRLIAVDGKIRQREVDYLNKNFGFSYSVEELQDVYENSEDAIDRAFDERFVNGISLMRKISDKLADAYKELLSLICDIIAESDEIVTAAEIAEIIKLKALCN